MNAFILQVRNGRQVPGIQNEPYCQPEADNRGGEGADQTKAEAMATFMKHNKLTADRHCKDMKRQRKNFMERQERIESENHRGLQEKWLNKQDKDNF
ncbi:hypothetical protein DPMN_044512 [Dreissena polymorpha]|uniref:Uncharacterized protein n=1 Tax=Dreissena polymorpha TaxID=45954 RepID=A0A9D4D4M8_DREPO|nr:hypothetical protein DPMN_044512 [Dreissena polymorpha]